MCLGTDGYSYVFGRQSDGFQHLARPDHGEPTGHRIAKKLARIETGLRHPHSAHFVPLRADGVVKITAD